MPVTGNIINLFLLPTYIHN